GWPPGGVAVWWRCGGGWRGPPRGVARREAGGDRGGCGGFLLRGPGGEGGDRAPLKGPRRYQAAKQRRPDVGREGGQQVEVNEQPVRCQATHRVGDGGALVAALGDVAAVAKAAHQLRPGMRGAARIPADLRRLVGEAIAGQRRQHEVERILNTAAMRGRVGERTDNFEQLDHRTRPAVRDDQGQRLLVLRLHVDEVDPETVDLGLELRQRVQPRRDPPEVVLAPPVTRQLLQHLRLHALRPIVDELLAGPTRGSNTPTQVVDGIRGNVDMERTDLGGNANGATHAHLPVCTCFRSADVSSVDDDEERLPFLDDVGGELRRLPAADVLHRVNRLGRHDQRFAGAVRLRRLTVDLILERAFEDVDDLLARMLVPD